MRHSLIALTLLLLPGAALSQEEPTGERAWQSSSSGISDPRVTAIAVHPTQGGFAIAGTSDGAIYRTEDSGANWNEVLRIFVSRKEQSGGRSRRTDTASDGDDGGREADIESAIEDELEEIFEEEKERIIDELSDVLGEDEAERVAEEEAQREVDRRREEIEARLRGDSDGEENVEAVETGREITEIAFHPRVPGVIYAATGDGVWRSPDDGQTWQHVLTGLGEGESGATTVLASLAAPDGGPRPLRVLAGTRGGLMVSEDAGDEWSRDTGALGSAEIRRLTAHATERHRVAVASDRGVFLSTDGALTWRNAFRTLGESGNILSLAFDPAPNGVLYIGTANGLFVLGNDAQVPTRRPERLPLPVYTWLRAVDAGVLLAATPRGIFRSEDRGVTFTPLLRGMPTPTVSMVDFSFADPETYWASTNLGVYRWRPAKPLPPGAFDTVPFADWIENAHRFAYQDMKTLRRYQHQAKMTRFLPRMQLSAGRGDLFSQQELLTPVIVSGNTVGFDRRTTGYDVLSDHYVVVQLTWGLDQLIFGIDHLRVNTLARQYIRRRNRRSARILRLGRELTEMRIGAATKDDDQALLDATNQRLRLMELEAYLDGATGGMLTREKKKKRSK